MKTKLSSFFKKATTNAVIRNISIVVVITLLLKAIGFYKESVVGATYGLSEQLDTFFIAFLIPGFIQNVFLESFKSVFIPNYVAELKTKNKIGPFQGTGFFVTILISLFFMLIAYLFTDIYLENLFGGHTKEYYDLVKLQFAYLLPCILFWGISSILSGLLNINDEFKYSSFGGIFVPISILICILLFKDELGSIALAIGTLIGSIVGFIYLLTIALYKKILAVTFPDFNNANARIMFAQIPAKISSSLLTGLHSVIDQYFAAQLVIGSIAAINYGMKIPAFAVGILVIAMSNVLLPYFSKIVIEEKERAFQQVFKIYKWVFIGATVIAILGILTSDFFVSLFFERKEFTSEDTQIVSNIQKIILVYLPFKISGMLLVNFLTSINKNNYMAIVSLISIILNVILDFILIKIYGVFGIAIATTSVVIIRNIVLFLFTLKQSRVKTIT